MKVARYWVFTMEPNFADSLIPTIHLHSSSIGSHRIFDPTKLNDDRSKVIINGCAAQHSTLRYAIGRLNALCGNIRPLWHPSFESLQKQWAESRWENHRLIHLIQVPELHLLIEFFLSGVKTLLDLIVQLVQSERVVKTNIHGFHNNGERVLKCLQNNVVKGRHEDAERITKIIMRHRREWINQVINQRDALIHPEAGAQQIMIQLIIDEVDGQLVAREVLLPHVEAEPINAYCGKVLDMVGQFSEEFLNCLKKLPPQKEPETRQTRS